MRWLAAQEPVQIFITTVTQAEVLYGIEIMPAGKRRARLPNAVEKLFAEEFRDRLLPFDQESARVFPKIVAGRDAAGRPISQFDAMIAAISRSRQAALATRNVVDFEHSGVRLVNPWNS
jgi:predicted nucleic acid-binding protein